MRTFVCLFPLLLAACPTSDTLPSDAQPGAAGAVPPGDQGAGGDPSAAAGGDPSAAMGPAPGADGLVAPEVPPASGDPGAIPGAGAPPPAGDGVVAAPGSAGPPGFASFVTNGQTVTISGTITGATGTVQVDFTRVKDNNGQKAPQALEVVKVTDGKFSVKAPSSMEGQIYVTAALLGADGMPGPVGGMAVAPIELTGRDLTVNITISDKKDWAKALPWWTADAPKPPAPGEAPPGGAVPGGPAPSGGAQPGAAPGSPAAPAPG